MSEKMNIYDRIAAVSNDVGYIKPTAYNEKTRKYYRDKENYYRSLQPSMLNHGLVMTKEITSFEETTFNDKDGRLCFRSTLAIRLFLKCKNKEGEEEQVFTDSIVGKNDYWDAGYLSCMTLAIIRGLEDFFMFPSEEVDHTATPIPTELVDRIFVADKPGLEKIFKQNPGFKENIYYQKLMKSRETILKLSLADQAKIKKGSQIPTPEEAGANK
jgi:hypothetical protein